MVKIFKGCKVTREKRLMRLEIKIQQLIHLETKIQQER